MTNPKVFSLVWSIGTILFIILSGYLIDWGAKLVIRWRGGSTKYQNQTFTGYFFASPWIVGFLVFVLGPALLSLYWGMTDYRISEPINWVGFNNYTKLFRDRRFITSLYNSFYMTLIGVPLQLLAGLGMAMLLSQRIRGRTFFRAVFYLPVLMATSTSVLFTWRLMLNANNGVVNSIIRRLNDFSPLYVLNGSAVYLTEIFSAFVVGLQSGNFKLMNKIIDAGFR